VSTIMAGDLDPAERQALWTLPRERSVELRSS
jgi:hypothetical protein